jgi:hypothetical protein
VVLAFMLIGSYPLKRECVCEHKKLEGIPALEFKPLF